MTTNNHPAHGPVSLDRLHQIRQYIERNNQYQNGGNRAYILADVLKVIDGAIAEFEEQDNPRPVMAVKGELGFIDNLEKIIEERDEDIDIGQLGSSNYDALMLAALDAFRASLPATVVPEEMFNNIDNPYGDEDLIYEQGKIEGWNACRAAMLQGIQPVSNRDELPLGYLQGHKDGLEWAAQLAEANHPQTGDWLYDDPIDLAKAIRKGPHMPELKLVPADADDNFYSWFGRFWHENYQQNNYTTSAKQMLGTMAEFAFRAGRESATHAGNSPVTPDGWIPLSERMPEAHEPIYIFHPDYGVDEGVWYDNQEDAFLWDSDCSRCRAIETVSHWMPMPALPAAPQQEVKS